MGLEGQPDVSLVGNIFEGSFTKEGTIAGNAIFEGVFKFSAPEARKKFDSTTSADQGAIWEQSGSNQGVIAEKMQGAGISEEGSA